MIQILLIIISQVRVIPRFQELKEVAESFVMDTVNQQLGRYHACYFFFKILKDLFLKRVCLLQYL